MRTKKETTTTAPRKTSPPMPYELVANPLPEDMFHRKLPRQRSSHFQDALSKLAAAKRGTVLQFQNAKCYGQVEKAAKKLGYECWYAVRGAQLFVQLMDTGEDK